MRGVCHTGREPSGRRAKGGGEAQGVGGESPSREVVFAPGRRLLTAGLVLTITFVGFESLAVATVLPDVRRDLGVVALYGWVFSAFMLGSLIGIVLAGSHADASGPARPFVLALTLFCIGLAAGGLAPSMIVLVIARFVQGLGGGAIAPIAYF